MSTKKILGRFILIALLGLGFVNPAGAVDFYVSEFTDSTTYTNSNKCSLRGAIIEANDIGGTNTIHLKAGTYTLSLAGDTGTDNIAHYEDEADSGDLDIDTNGTLTIRQREGEIGETIINGDWSWGTNYDGNKLGDRIFHIISGTVVLNDLTIQNGYRNDSDHNCADNDDDDSGLSGGGVYNAATTTMNDCIIKSNISKSGGGISNRGSAAVLTMTDCDVNENTAAFSGGGIKNTGSTLTMTGCTVNSNTAASSGGGILNNSDKRAVVLPPHEVPSTGTLTMTGCTVNENTAGSSGGGINNHEGKITFMKGCFVDLNTATSGGGGGIYNHVSSTINLMENCSVSNNKAPSGGGGGIHNHGSEITSMKVCTVNLNEAGTSGGGIHNHDNTTLLDMTDCDVNENTAGTSGGGIHNHVDSPLKMTDCDVNLNEAGTSGGGIHNSNCVLTIADCAVNGNIAELSGGGIQNSAGTLDISYTTIDSNSSTSAGGGGIDTKATDYNGVADATLVGCTVSKNTSLASGGGIRNHSAYDSTTLTLINTTISGNSSVNCTGGVHTNDGGYAATKLLFCTVADNTTTNGGYSGINDCGDVTIENTIVAYNTGASICPSALTFAGLNIIYEYIPIIDTPLTDPPTYTLGKCTFGGAADVDDPLLEALADNGGHTFTHALQTGSPAIPPSSPAIPPSPALDRITCTAGVYDDQRRVSRPQSIFDPPIMKCDIGAFEAFGDTPEDDGDGVDALTETGAPNSGDGDGDGILDAFQSKVTSLKSSDDTNYITLEIIGSCGRFEKVVTHDEASQGGGDPNFDYPFGLVAFEIPLESPCESARVRAYFHGATEPIAGPYRKYGPIPDYTSGSEWYSLLAVPNEVTFGTALIGPNQDPVYYAEFTLIAGKLGDDTADKDRIVDQGGPGIPDPNAIPTLNEWGMIIFTLLIVITGIYYRRKEQG